jgi:hypothetical protein
MVLLASGGCTSLASAATYDFNLLGGYGNAESSSTVNSSGTFNGAAFTERADRKASGINLPTVRAQASANLDVGLYTLIDYTYAGISGGNQADTNAFEGAVFGNTVGTGTINGNHAWDMSAAGGYEFKVYEPNAQGYFHFIPLAGYARSEQHVGFQGTSVSMPSKGTTNTAWTGPWLGSRMMFELPANVMGFFQFEYHFLDYDASATYTRRQASAAGNPTAIGLQTLTQTSDATGWVIDAGFDWSPHLLDLERYANWYVRVGFQYRDYFADQNSGVERVLLSNGVRGTDTLHDASWSNISGTIGIGLRF